MTGCYQHTSVQSICAELKGFVRLHVFACSGPRKLQMQMQKELSMTAMQGRGAAELL